MRAEVYRSSSNDVACVLPSIHVLGIKECDVVMLNVGVVVVVQTAQITVEERIIAAIATSNKQSVSVKILRTLPV